MADIVYPSDTLSPGNPNNVNDVKAIKTTTAAYLNGSGWVDAGRLAIGSVTADKLAANAVGDSTEGAAAGLNGASTVRRGKSIIATEESTTSTSYTTLTTPDRVQSVVLPTDGLIFVAYVAEWKKTVGAASVYGGLYLGSNQVVKAHAEVSGPSMANVGVEASLLGTGTSANVYTGLFTSANGMVSGGDNGSAYAAVTTGQMLGATAASATAFPHHYAGVGIIPIFAAAGTYDVSVRFKASSGSVTAKNRKLWVWTMGF